MPIGLCPQEFESPRCRLQGWREAKENSWRLLALRQRKWEQKKCGSLEPSPLNYCQTREKVVESWKDNTPCGTRAHNLRTRSPTPCPLGQGG